MKNLIIFIVLTFVFCLQAFSQGNSICPNISVTGPNDIVFRGQTFTFTAKIDGINLDKISYLWSISSGTIVDGQGTSILKVLQEENEGRPLIARVEITGLPQNCVKSGYTVATTGISDPQTIMKIDEFFLQPSQMDKAKMKIFLIALNNDPYSKGVIFEQIKGNTTYLAIKQKLNKLSAYLKFKKFQTDRIILFIAKGNENLTQLWLVPAGASPPVFDDSIQISLPNYKKDLAKIFAKK